MDDQKMNPGQGPPDSARPAPENGGSGDRRPGQRLLGLGLIVVLAGFLALGAWRHYAKHSQVMETAEKRRAAVLSVRAGTVRASGEQIALTLPATTSAYAAANIFARASGYIEKRFVDIGSRVKEGDVLAQITAPELDHQIAQAVANLAQAEAALRLAQANRDLARVTYERDAKLVAQGYVSIQQGDVDRLTYEARQSDVKAAEATVAAQREQIRVLRQQKDYQRVVAPFAGVVTQRNIDNGSLVQADAVSGTSLFSLAKGDVIRIQLYVPQDAAIGVGPGVETLVRVPEMPGRTFPGQVTRIADALQPNTRTLLTEIDVPNPDAILAPGIYCTVELRIPRKSPSFIVPGEAVIFNRAGLQVAVVKDGAVHISKIAVVRDLGTEVEVSEGVQAGDKVMLNPPADLSDGGKVTIRE